MIKRILAEKLIEFTNYFPVVGVIGPRQVGKTTLVKENIPLFKKECVYLDLESSEDYNKLTDPELYLRSLDNKTVILDEIQLKPEIFSVLRSLIDRKREAGRFIILGSASPDLIRDSSESLAGRIVYLELQPLNINELKNQIDFEKLWLRGGFPNAILTTNEISIYWMNSFIRSYIERDLPLLGLKAPVRVIENLWTMLAHINGNLLNYSQLSSGLGVTANSVKTYIRFFEQSFLIRLVKPYFANTKKRLVKSPKLFFTDTGILHQLLKIYNRDALFGHPNIGNSWEAFVMQQIISNLPLTIELYFYRTQDSSEIDLVLIKDAKVKVAIEIKNSNSPKLTKGNTLAIETLQSQYNFIVTPSSDDYLIRKNVRVCNINDFVFQYLPKLITG